LDSIKTGNLILKRRKEIGLTQRELGEQLNVSDKTISKWERGMGCPDIASINDLAEVLGVNATEILSGESLVNDNDSGNMKKTRLYVCPHCQNIITSTSDLILNCCGKKLIKLKANKENDDSHTPKVEILDGDLFVKVDHEMEKGHYSTFIAFVTADKASVHKLYPEQNAEVRFPGAGHGILYAYCNRHGLWMKTI
jgi:transcriptional regulator with XRE-family HTH domain